MRLKDKLGNRSNASSELEFEDAAAWMVGEEGAGVRTIIEMVNGTRLDCVIGSVSIMRQAVTRAAWHVTHRRAFGSLLVDKPLMQNVLADLELETEAATLVMIRLAGAFDRAETDPHEAAFRRIATPIAKYWVTGRCTPVVREAMECLGGNGYVEESIMPRLFRESPLNAIWEGSGNVIALDVLRALTRERGAGDAFLAELERTRGTDPVLDDGLDEVGALLASPADPETGARRLVERMAEVWAATLLVRAGIEGVATAFIRSRLGGDHGTGLGTLPADAPLAALTARTLPPAD
jgi:putative acyl-CoA dehydrogenase